MESKNEQRRVAADSKGEQVRLYSEGATNSPPASKRFTLAEVHAHRSPHSCWVIHAGRVYDVTRFVRMHPGGEAVIATRAGTDLGRLLSGPPHRHSSNAYRWLEQYRIGELDTRRRAEPGERPPSEGEERPETVRPETERPETVRPEPGRAERAEWARRRKDGFDADRSQEKSQGSEELLYKTVSTENDLVDWSKPLLWQVGHLGDKYDEWVHQPVDRNVRLFQSGLLEYWTKTAWYIIPLVWIPIITLMSLSSYRDLCANQQRVFTTFTDGGIGVSRDWFPGLFAFGFFAWSLVEYSLHRFLFHLTPPAHSYHLITLHFLLHGQHHKSPFDGSRLVFPPLAALVTVGAFYSWMLLLLPNAVTGSLIAGCLAGYVIYDLTHYYLHYGAPRRGSYLYMLKAYHVKHHFEHQRLGFGITSKLWDYPFRTLIPEEAFEKSRE